MSNGSNKTEPDLYQSNATGIPHQPISYQHHAQQSAFNASSTGNYPVDDEINLLELWQVLVRRRGIVMLFAFVVIVSVVIATALSTPLYRASLSLQIERESVKVVDFQDVQPFESGNARDFYQTQYELLKSRSLVRRVIDELNLDRNKTFTDDLGAPSGLGWLMSNAKLLFVSAEDRNDNELEGEEVWIDDFLSRLTIAPIKNSRLVKIQFDSASPALSAKIVNVYARNFISMNLERRFEASSYAKSFLEDRLSDVKARLEDSEKNLINFARDNEIINLSNQENINTHNLRAINSALSKAEQDRISHEAKYEQMLSAGGSTIIDFLQSSLIQQLKQTAAKYRAEYQDKLRLFKPGYPEMRQLDGQITEIERQIATEIENIRNSIKSSYETSQVKEVKLKESLEKMKKEVLAFQDRSIQYNILNRELLTSRELYKGLLQRMKEVGVAGGVSTNNMSIVDAAEVPKSKFKPRILLNTTLAVVVGLMGGVFLAFFIDYLDDTVKQVEDIERGFQLPILGMIPDASAMGENVHLGLQSYYEPASVLAEAYRSTRASLMLSTTEGAPDVLLFTSSAPNEGKTTSAINTAIAFSQMGKNTLLIDCDLRNPSVHKVFGISGASGLTSYLAGSVNPADICIATEIEHLFVMAAGPMCPNPAELLAGEKLKDLLEIAKEKFDYVLLDGPPVLGLADAPTLASVASGTAFIVELGHTRQNHLESAIKRLRSVNANIVGGLLTKMKSSSGTYDYYGEYYGYQLNDSSATKLPI